MAGPSKCAPSSEGDEVWISVADEGLGINDNEKELIFERFHQLDGGYSRRAGGLGIGLALAHQLIEMHGGRIWVENNSGPGSTFTFSVPVVPPKNPETPAGGDRSSATTAAPNGGMKKTGPVT